MHLCVSPIIYVTYIPLSLFVLHLQIVNFEQKTLVGKHNRRLALMFDSSIRLLAYLTWFTP